MLLREFFSVFAIVSKKLIFLDKDDRQNCEGLKKASVVTSIGKVTASPVASSVAKEYAVWNRESGREAASPSDSD
jgi:hypothetical protein